MKRFGNLYPKMYYIENIRLAHKNAKRGKFHYSEVKKIDANPEKYFLEIQRMLCGKTFRNSSYEKFTKMDKGGTKNAI
jgi:RNA-directed DNA polymerase